MAVGSERWILVRVIEDRSSSSSSSSSSGDDEWVEEMQGERERLDILMGWLGV